MLNILKAEIKDNLLLLVIPYILVLLPIFINIYQDWPTAEFDLRAIKSMMGVGIIFIILLRLVNISKNKKDRFHFLLPLSVRKIAITRLCFAITIWLSFLIFYWIGSSTAKPYRIDLIFWEALSITGFILITNAFVFIYRDITSVFYGKFKNNVSVILYNFMIIIGYLIFYLLFSITIPYFDFLKHLVPFQIEGAEFSSSLTGTIFFNVIGLGLSSLSIYVFTHRKSYLK